MSVVNGFQVGSDTLKYNYESLENYNTPDFSTSPSQEYTVGDYVTYQGKLYRCTTATTGGTWVSGNWTLAVLSDDLKSVISEVGDSLTTKAPAIIDTASGIVVSLSNGADDMPIKTLTANIDLVQTGTGEASPSNVRPISGWTECKIYPRGANIATLDELAPVYSSSTAGIDVTESNGKLTFSGTANASGTKYFGSMPLYSNRIFPVKAGVKYTVSSKNTGNGDAKLQGNIIFDDGTQSSGWITVGYADQHSGRRYVTFTPAKNGRFALIPTMTLVSGTAYSATIEDVQLVAYSDSYAYPAEYYGESNGVSVPISWQTEAGTVYSGSITLNEDGSADLTVDYASVTFDGSSDEGWTTYSTHGFSPSIGIVMKSGTRQAGFCDTFKILRPSDGSISSAFGIALGLANSAMYFAGMITNIAEVTDLASWKTWLSTHNVTVVYPLATTATYHLTGIDQVTTLLGTNNIWADCGDITDLEYVADTKLYIQRLTQPTEDDMVANNNIASGKYFMVGNSLYLATTAILAGEKIIPASNCTAISLAQALNAINS